MVIILCLLHRGVVAIFCQDANWCEMGRFRTVPTGACWAVFILATFLALFNYLTRRGALMAVTESGGVSGRRTCRGNCRDSVTPNCR